MKICFALFLLTLVALSQSACDSNDYYGYDWEKKNTILKVPVVLDSLRGDTLNVRILSWGLDTVPKVIYSSTLDSFVITADIKGENFSKPGADTLWKPGYEYEWHNSRLTLNYLGDIMKIERKNSQTPQLTPFPENLIIIEKMQIEVPKSVKQINYTYW